MQEPKGMEDIRGRYSKSRRTEAYLNSETDIGCTDLAWVWTKWSLRDERGGPILSPAVISN